jgi:hypothetical protein
MTMDLSLREFLAEEVAAYQAMAREHGYRPPKWTMPEPSRDLLQTLCRRFPTAPNAFEFGSGRTTAALRAVCRSVTSVDNSSEDLQKTEELSGQVPRRETDLTAFVPLSRCWIKVVPCRSFSFKKRPELRERLAAADLILVDRPSNPASRAHVLLTALRHAKVGALIVLDDLNVEATLGLAQRVTRDNPGAVGLFILPIDHIVGVFQKTAAAKIAWRPGLREIIGAWRAG